MSTMKEQTVFAIRISNWLLRKLRPEASAYLILGNGEEDAVLYPDPESGTVLKQPGRRFSRFDAGYIPEILMDLFNDRAQDLVDPFLTAHFLLILEEEPLCRMMTIHISELMKREEETGVRAEKYLKSILMPMRFLKRSSLTADEYRGMLHTDGEAALFDRLRTKRAAVAAENRVSACTVFSNRAIYEMCLRRPADMDQFRDISGVGPVNSALYGEQFLDVISGRE